MRDARNLSGAGRWLRHRSTTIDRSVSRHRLARRLRTSDPVVIYAMGNVGTSSLQASIEAVTSQPVLKAHVISSAGIERTRATRGERPRGQWRSEQLRAEFRRPREWTLICGVRDPVARAVSTYFSDGLSSSGATVDAVADHVSVLTGQDWFAEELEPTTGLDVYASAFEPSAGCATYRQGGFRVLLLRAEDLRRVGPMSLAAHLGVDKPVEILDRNLGVHKRSGTAYSRFTQTERLPRAIVDEAYRSPLARHFYSEAELDAFTRRWCG